MPQTLATPVLQVDANVIHQVDTNNPDNLHSMWTVFTKCADAVAQGRRLENLSWRLWNRETFCCESVERVLGPNSTTTLPQEIQRYRRSSDDLPLLSGSVDSVIDEEAVDDFHSETPALEIVRPVIKRQDSCASSRSRGKERHITSDDLEKMVVDIIQAKGTLNPLPNLASSFQPPVQTPEICLPTIEHSGSTTTESSVSSSDANSVESSHQPSPIEMASSQTRPTIVVRGFSPSSVPVCRITSQSQKGPSPSAIPAPTAAPAARFVQPKGRTARFALGASSGDDSYSDRGSLDMRAQKVPQKPRKNMFTLGGSSEENSPENEQQPQPTQQNNMMDYANSSAIEDDDDDDAIYDESAIDDEDDSSEWEDSNEESGKSSVDSKLNFKRVDSSANLTSRQSLISLALAKNDDQVQRSSRMASQSTSALPRTRMSPQRAHSSSPNDSDDAPLMMKRGARAPPMKPISEVPRSVARPILPTTNSNSHQTMLSPKTTRRNMMATELTESLRRHLVWERRQRNQNPVSAAQLQRRHTSNDVANLKQYPDKPYMNNNNVVDDSTSYDMNATDGYLGNSYYTHGW